MSWRPERIVGLDLGDGETCVAVTEVMGKLREPRVFPLGAFGPGMPTAIGVIIESSINEDGEPAEVRRARVGEAAILEAGLEASEINFKLGPEADFDEWNAATARVVDFAAAVLKKIAAEDAKLLEECGVIVGCPTSWFVRKTPNGETFRDAYERKLKAQIENLQVVSESRSALLQARDHWGLSPETLDETILVVDIGSSTTDVSMLRGIGQAPVDLPFGSDLGLRRLDKILLPTFFEAFPEHREAIEKNYGEKAAKVIFLSRLLKENAFGAKNELPSSLQGEPWANALWSGLGSMRLHEVLLDRPFGKEKSTWRERFLSLLRDVSAHEDVRKTPPKHLIVIGGGANIAELVSEAQGAFPNAHLIQPHEHKREVRIAVAKGLAGFGRWQERIARFRAAADDVLASSDYISECADERLELQKAIESTVFKSLYGCIQPIKDRWKNGDIKTENVYQIKQQWAEEAVNWFDKPVNQTVIASALGAVNAKVNGVLQPEFNKLTEQFHIKVGDFEAKIDLSPRRAFEQIGEKGLDGALMEILRVFVNILNKIPTSFRQGGVVGVLADITGWLASNYGVAVGSVAGWIGTRIRSAFSIDFQIVPSGDVREFVEKSVKKTVDDAAKSAERHLL